MAPSASTRSSSWACPVMLASRSCMSRCYAGRLREGDVDVWVRALVFGSWACVRIITIHLKPTGVASAGAMTATVHYGSCSPVIGDGLVGLLWLLSSIRG